jgi:hypothetical protein
LTEGWAIAPDGPFFPASRWCGGGYVPETVDELVRMSDLVAVVEPAGHDHGFFEHRIVQYSTHYVRVLGYVKDIEGRGKPFLKVLAAGGWDDRNIPTGDRSGYVSEPPLRKGVRYLLYLRRNCGIEGGGRGRSSSYVGSGDEYWIVDGDIGKWWQDGPDLSGRLLLDRHWNQKGVTGGSFSEEVRRAREATERERRGLPLPERWWPPEPGDGRPVAEPT